MYEKVEIIDQTNWNVIFFSNQSIYDKEVWGTEEN